MTNPLLPNYLEAQAYLYRLNKAKQQAIPALIQKPEPYDLQREILTSTAKRKVIVAGRQVGKTITAALSAVGGQDTDGRGLLDGALVHISSTSQDQSDMFWDYITTWLSPVMHDKMFYKNESRRIIRYRGGQIKVKTGSNPDALRGGTVDKLILDEGAFLHHEAWAKVGQPMLVARDGVLELYTTPNRRNWVFNLYNYALLPENTDWQAWNFSTLSNPYLPESAVKLMIQDMTEEDYKQEILAEFLEGQGAVFRHVDDRCTLLRQKPDKNKRYVFGIDWAQQQDFTVVTVIDADRREMVAYERFNQQDYTLQRARITSLYDQWKPVTIISEDNSIGNVNNDILQRDRLPVTRFVTTAQSKPPLIESLVLAFDRGELTCLDDVLLKGELMAYERKITATGRSQYSAPEGLHDDMVMSLALAWHGVNAPQPHSEIINIPDIYDRDTGGLW